MYFSTAHDIFEKKNLDVPPRLSVKKKRFFPKMIKIPQNHILGVLTPAEHESGIKKLLRGQPEGLHVDFCENFKFVL